MVDLNNDKVPPLRGRRKLLASSRHLAEEILDDFAVRSVADLKREIKEDLSAIGNVAEDAVSLSTALTKQLRESLGKLDVSQLLFLALRAAEMSGDTSFLESWKVEAKSDEDSERRT